MGTLRGVRIGAMFLDNMIWDGRGTLAALLWLYGDVWWLVGWVMVKPDWRRAFAGVSVRR